MEKTIEEKIAELAAMYAGQLRQKMDQRVLEMQTDDRSHSLIYRVLGITDEEGQLIDVYQNKGRFLYRYAGTFLEEVAKLCLQEKYPTGGPAKIPNTQGRRPATFEIDYLIGQEAFEIKWRDATTDGDHITKEHTRIKVIAEAGYTPIRMMFFYPNREQAIRIQQTLETLYTGVQGRYYYGDRAWDYLKECTGIDLKAILEKLAAESTQRS